MGKKRDALVARGLRAIDGADRVSAKGYYGHYDGCTQIWTLGQLIRGMIPVST